MLLMLLFIIIKVRLMNIIGNIGGLQQTENLQNFVRFCHSPLPCN